MTNELTFTIDTTKKLVYLYNRAKKAGQSSFVFQGQTLVTDYAYYLIQHLVNNEKIITGKFNEKKIFKIK